MDFNTADAREGVLHFKWIIKIGRYPEIMQIALK